MPLHDWSSLSGWDGLHDIWIVELLRHIKPRLPEGYRAYIGTAPALSVGAPLERPDVSVRHWRPEAPAPEPTMASDAAVAVSEPDIEVASPTLDPQSALFVTAAGRLVAAVEIVSPRNKDRPSARAIYLARYLSYLMEGANLLLIDVHTRPANFSFADSLAAELHIDQPATQPPFAVSYRVGEPAAAGGRLIGIWRRPLAIGQTMPSVTLPLTVKSEVLVDLESTYSRSSADVYLS